MGMTRLWTIVLAGSFALAPICGWPQQGATEWWLFWDREVSFSGEQVVLVATDPVVMGAIAKLIEDPSVDREVISFAARHLVAVYSPYRGHDPSSVVDRWYKLAQVDEVSSEPRTVAELDLLLCVWIICCRRQSFTSDYASELDWAVPTYWQAIKDRSPY